MSEGQATFGNSDDRAAATSLGLSGSGSGLETANWLTTGFVRSRRTMAVYQPAIGACYDSTQYSSKEFVSARDPWSGWIGYDTSLAVLAHFARFARLGWESPDATADGDGNRVWRAIPQASFSPYDGGNPPKLPSGPASRPADPRVSWLTLASPDSRDFSTVIVNDSDSAQTLRLHTDLTRPSHPIHLTLWQSRAAETDEPATAHLLERVGTAEATTEGTRDSLGSVFTVTVAPHAIATATTLDLSPEDVGTVPDTPDPTDPEARPVLFEDPASGLLYSDDFTDNSTAGPDHAGRPPKYGQTLNGAFETTGEHTLRQQLTRSMAGPAWNDGDPLVLIGDGRWLDHRLGVSVRFPSSAPGNAPAATPAYAALCARQYRGSGDCLGTSGAELRLSATGDWEFLSRGDTLAQGRLAGFDPRSWHECVLQVAGDRATASIDRTRLLDTRIPLGYGRIGLGSSFDRVEFAHLRVRTVPGTVPAYTGLLDNAHLRDWRTGRALLRYSGTWRHDFHQGMYVLGRTLSATSEPGASLSLPFTGTGVDFIGLHENARVSVTVDGAPVRTPVWHHQGDSAALSSLPGSAGEAILPVRGLDYGRHTVTLTLLSRAGTSPDENALTLDAIGILGRKA